MERTCIEIQYVNANKNLALYNINEDQSRDTLISLQT